MLLKLWIIPTIFSLSLNALGSAPGTYFQVKSELKKTTRKELISWVNELVKVSAPSRMVGLPGHAKARDYLKETISSIDKKNTGKLTVTSTPPQIEAALQLYQNDFDQKVEGKIPKSHKDYQKWATFTSHMKEKVSQNKAHPVENIIWEKEGINTQKVLIVTAHYDTISHDPKNYLILEKAPMPGANYNATGVAVALGLIKILAQIDLNYSVKVVFLDWQGLGFLGSYAYAKDLKELAKTKSIMGVINLEMLGQDTSYLDKTKKTGNMKVYFRPEATEEKFVKQLVEHGSKVASNISFEMWPKGFENSDNFRFWEAGLISATFSQNWEADFNPKFYQSPQDTPETLNHKTLYKAYQYLGGAVLGTLLDITK